MTLLKTRKKNLLPPPRPLPLPPLGGGREVGEGGGANSFSESSEVSYRPVCNLVFNTEQTNKQAKTCCINVVRVSKTDQNMF